MTSRVYCPPMRTLWGGIVLALAALAMAATDKREDQRLAALRATAERITPLHSAKGKPRAGDWLLSHPEPGQTFDEYLVSRPNRPTATRTTIYIQPLGEFDEKQSPLIDDTYGQQAGRDIADHVFDNDFTPAA